MTLAASDGSASAIPQARGSDHVEHLLVWSWRRIVEGQGYDAEMAHEFERLCGTAGPKVFFVLYAFLDSLEDASRRELVLRAPNPYDVTADERSVLGLLAAARAGDDVLLDARLEWLARPELRGRLRLAVQALAGIMDANGLSGAA